MEQLIELMAYYSKGTSVELQVMRLGQTDYSKESVTVILGAKAEATQ